MAPARPNTLVGSPWALYPTIPRSSPRNLFPSNLLSPMTGAPPADGLTVEQLLNALRKRLALLLFVDPLPAAKFGRLIA